MQNIRAAAVQFQHVNGEIAENLRIMEGLVVQAAGRGVKLLVFPECCVTGYWFLRHLTRDQLAALAEPFPSGPTAQTLLAWSRQHDMTIGAGVIESDAAGKLYNSYFVAMPDGTWACHRKLHTFVSAHLTSGDEYTVFDSPHGCRLAVLTCYDNNIPENSRMCALRGAEIILAPHQTGGCASRSPHAMKVVDRRAWDERATNPEALAAEFMGDKGRGWILRWLPARAHDNGVFYVFANGVGLDDDEVRTGNAMILDPYGRILAESTALGDDLVVADLDASLREECTGVRWIRARRPELYTELAQRTGKEQDIRKVRFGVG